VQERLDDLADLPKISRFIEALVDADKLERKNFKPENFHRVGLADQATIWIGATAKNRSGRYARILEGEERVVWLISSNLEELSANPADWLQKDQDIR